MLYKDEVRSVTALPQPRTEVAAYPTEDFLICLKKAIHIIEKRYPPVKEAPRWQE
ncbi:MAG: hypothetical protein AB1665_09085 [Candidatus Thermoplasmatota archaeon]